MGDYMLDAAWVGAMVGQHPHGGSSGRYAMRSNGKASLYEAKKPGALTHPTAPVAQPRRPVLPQVYNRLILALAVLSAIFLALAVIFTVIRTG